MSSAPETTVPRSKPWEEANPWVSGILAYLIPGAGHFYQGRLFKAAIYFVCIHGAFFTGMCLGEGMTVHHKVAPNTQGWRKFSLSYAAQFGSGVWALPAIAQSRRVDDKDNQRMFSLKSPITSSFQGEIEATGPGSNEYQGPLLGTIALQPAEGPTGRDVDGQLTGTLDGKPFELSLSGGFEIEKPIGASPGRLIRMRGVRRENDHPNLDLTVRGTIPRPIWNWFEVPPDTPQLQEITGRLGKYWELALVFTWIAGLLNVLAIWDCVKGPSLGFGDEQPADPHAGSASAPPEPGK